MRNTILYRYKRAFDSSRFLFSALRASVLFAAAVGVNFFAATYATDHVSNSVTDLVLSNTPVFDVDAIFIYGAIALFVTIAVVALSYPQRIPFVLESLAIFMLIRSVFVTLTHIGPFPQHASLDLVPSMRKVFMFGGDLFFSGHTGFPFLMALVFWRISALRYLFLAWSVLFAITALLGHYHYSIDVLSAYFITFTIYHIAAGLFPEDQKLLLS